jgi:hypothetical protein
MCATRPGDHKQHGGEALSAAASVRKGQKGADQGADDRTGGAAAIASVVLPFLEKAKGRIAADGRRLDFGVRKLDVATGEGRSVYFRVVNTDRKKASRYYIVDLSSQSPLVIVVDTLDIGSGVRRREILDDSLRSHEDVTEEVLQKFLDRAALEASHA